MNWSITALATTVLGGKVVLAQTVDVEPIAWVISEFGVIILVFILIVTGKLIPVRSVRDRESLWEARLKEMREVLDVWKQAYARQERINDQHQRVLDEILRGVELSTDTIEGLREVQERR